MRRENVRTYIFTILLPLFGFALLTGCIVGIIVGFYNWTGKFFLDYSKELYALCRRKMKYFPIPLFGSIALGFMIGGYIYKFPEIRGSGIPYIEAVAQGKLKVTWYLAIPLMFITSMLSLVSGMSFGKEGPSIFIGGCIGYGIASMIPFARVYKNLLVAAGASTGLAIAFSAPAAGLLFSVEEIYRKFSSVITMTSAMTVCIGVFLKELIFGKLPLEIGDCQYEFSALLFLLSFISGVFGGLCGAAFNVFLRFVSREYKKMTPPVPMWFYPVIPAIIGSIVATALPDAGFDGVETLEKLFHGEITTWRIVVSFVIKFLFTSLCFGSSTTGGLFIPTLSTGALFGGTLAKIYIAIGLPKKYENYVIMVTISAFFTGCVRAPLTATIIIPEFSMKFTGFIGSLTASAFAYVAAELTRVPPFYEELVDNLMENYDEEHPQPPSIDLNEFVFIVDSNSRIRGLDLNELTLPRGTAFSRIVRNRVPMVPTDDLVLRSRDEVWFVAEEASTFHAEDELKSIF